MSEAFAEDGTPLGSITNDITIQGRKQKIACATGLRRTSRVSRQATVEVRVGTVTVGLLIGRDV